MNFDFSEWLNLALRWLHLTAGIAWIGSSFYFVWLDNHLKPPAREPGPDTPSGELWSVHGGGFYHNEKFQVAPGHMPDELHWFKWEAYFTWLSGFSLLVLVYYVGAQSFLIDPAKSDLGPAEAIALGLMALAGGWIFYDLLCRSLPNHPLLLGAVWFAFLVGMAIGLNDLFTARGAYLHIGAMLGTAMVGNVFFVIIPNQRKVVADLVAGRQPDPALGYAAKQRSVHNNYMTLPVLFIMISHHYPMTYGAQRPWLVLALLGLTGVAVRHVFNLRHRARPTGAAMAVAAALALVSVTYVSLERTGGGPAPGAPRLAFADVQPIFARHCVSCHSDHPTNPAFTAPPLGVHLDSYDHARAVAERIRKVAVDAEVMPLGNLTGMTREERQKLGDWIAQGTPR
ncbi:urate hydroxylase PuuD [Novosphingobium album (ex Liu et al. 2023)]|uniref:Urate hydroxylase PuuD n=1 Tax=Novosphingobium album (ex Liu et al. 2023) TaxID=3031130 RepID=A0ABT5WMP8_9SPHN|nr:urate hydroxylase PuuD [Novosphingobium album (ex Liu et al. 2023)]MDE8651318.1 urate hydroxylase PuuD [Novosphingobium album (ex Liu et al. 2023)]